MTKQNQHNLIFTCTDGHFGCISREARIHKVVCAGETPYQVSFLYLLQLHTYLGTYLPYTLSTYTNTYAPYARTNSRNTRGKKKKKKKNERQTSNEQQPDTYLYGSSILRYVTASAEKEFISDPPGMKSRTEFNLL